MKLQGRIVNTKRHTVGYKIGGRNRSRKEAVQLAKQGKVEGVYLRRGGNDEYHIVALPGHTNLESLPTRVDARA